MYKQIKLALLIRGQEIHTQEILLLLEILQELQQLMVYILALLVLIPTMLLKQVNDLVIFTQDEPNHF
jgi:hypothetical protein